MTDRSLTGVDAGTLSALEVYELAVDELRKATFAVEQLGGLIDSGDAGWMTQSLREIAEHASGAALFITSEVLHVRTVADHTIAYVREGLQHPKAGA